MAHETLDGIFVQIVRWEDCCCPWAYLVLMQESGEAWERRTGVGRRTLVRWRRKLRCGEITCRRADTCLVSRLRQLPSQDRDSASDGAYWSLLPLSRPDEPQG